VRSRDDVRRLLVPIQESTDLSDDEEQIEAAEELEQILQSWDDPAFVKHAGRAQEILDELNDAWSGDGPVDMLELGERRVVLDALSLAIAYRLQLEQPT
jgi:ATPase subunit of ABC transporter with duplicated ATPase domains